MGQVDITPEFLGELGECCLKQYSSLNGWAWTSTEKIYKKPVHNNRLEFAFGFERILVQIPFEIQQEIHEISKPSNRDEASPSFVYDYLACKAYASDDPRLLDEMKFDDFRWVEVKTGYSQLSNNQIRKLNVITIPLVVFRVPNILDSPNEWKIVLKEGNSDFWLKESKQNSD